MTRTGAAAPSISKGERTAARIRDVALDQFSRLGFERVMMAEIAEAAGVSQPTLHYHFQDKVQLWRSAMLALGAAIAEEERLMDAAPGATALERLRQAMAVFVQISRKHPALGRIIVLEGMAGGERLQWLDDNLTGKRNRRITKLVAEAVAAGDLKPYPPEMILITLQTGAVGTLNLAPMMRTSFGFDPDEPAARAAHERMVLDALLGGFLTDKAKLQTRETTQ